VELAEVQRHAQELARNLDQAMVGKPREIELLLVGLLCQGHVLIEDVPGVGKTVLARSRRRRMH
jgi:MoxR-like ATPase